MPRITKVYTRTGDDGLTMLGSGARVPKTAARVVAYGSVDELNAQIGMVLTSGVEEALVTPLRTIQNELFHAGAELCMPPGPQARPGPRLESRHVAGLEALMDRLSEGLEPLQNFVLPGGDAAAAALHVARTVCRRAERDAWLLAAQEPVGADLLHYLNRLSDTLFVMSRYQNQQRGVPEPLWDSRA
ncbi:MAG: cob(I)yrinic acid a,c-diamide adenosyltransferase [Phycisphaerales bacterium]|nr:cob(I)yrinic acid a,c-diamide adenosyltransferase [Phycisphaerales bacterium]